MQVQPQEIRHTALLFLIVAIVPLIFYPNDLGLRFDSSMVLYILGELAYFGLIVYLFMDSPPGKVAVTASLMCLGFRISAGLCFSILLFLITGVPIGEAFGGGMWLYKPAILLHTLTAPFILLSLFRTYFELPDKKGSARFAYSPARPEEERVATRPEITTRPAAQPVIIGATKTKEIETVERGHHDFDSAMKHVFDLSAVKFCVLFDDDGLPVAFAGDHLTLRDTWAPIGRLIADQIQGSLGKAGDLVLEGFHLEVDAYRLHLTMVCDMWFLVGADRQSEELEKVRMGQAVEMIKRIYHQKYVEAEPKQVREETHV